MTRDEVRDLRKGALITDPKGVDYEVVKVAGLKHANLRYRKIRIVNALGGCEIAYDGDQMVDRGWKLS